MPEQIKKRHAPQKAGVFVLVLFACMVMSSGAFAQQSELQQEILEPDCSVPGNCDMEAPTITSVSKRGGLPVIIGKYDVAFTKTLLVVFGGRTYTLGVDQELSTKSDVWRLDLRRLSPPLTVGTYELIVETIGFDDVVKQVRALVTITQADIAAGSTDTNGGVEPEIPDIAPDDIRDNETEPDKTAQRPQPIARHTTPSLVSVIALAAMVVLSGASYGLLAIRRRILAKKDVL